MDFSITTLSPEQREHLFNAILDAFPQKGDLSQLMYLKLGENLDRVAAGQNHSDLVLDLVIWLISNGKVVPFLKGALERNPDNARLKAIGNELLAQFSHAQKEPGRSMDVAPEKSFVQRVTNNPVVNVSGTDRSTSRQFENEERSTGTSKVYSDGSLDISDKRGQKTQDAKSSNLVFATPEKTIQQLAKSKEEAKNLKVIVKDQRSRIDQLNQFLHNAKFAIAEVNELIKKYEEVNQRIEPHLISCNLLDEYIILCGEYLFDHKHPTEENLKAMNRQAMKILKDCQKDNFSEWMTGLAFPDKDPMIVTHQALCASVKQGAQKLEGLLMPDCELQQLNNTLKELSAAVNGLLDSWTKAQGKLHDEITSRLARLREELA